MAVNPEESYLFDPLVRHRAKMPAWRRKHTRDGIYNIPWLFPRAAELDYARTLRKYYKVMIDGFLEFVEPQYDQWLKDYRQDAEEKQDDYPGDLKNLVTFINSVQEEIFGDVEDYRTAYLLKKASGIDNFNVSQWGKFTGAVLGADAATAFLLPTEPWLDDVLNSWIERNEELWTNVTKTFIYSTTQIVRNGVEQGLLWTNTRNNLVTTMNMPMTRANLIARDQTAKLNSSLSERRMGEAGLNLYKWLTAGDERVRGNPKGKYPKAKPSHHVMNGKTARWDKKELISDDGGKTWRKKKGKEEPLQVGWAVQCRCTGIPIFRELLTAADKHIDRSPHLQVA